MGAFGCAVQLACGAADASAEDAMSSVEQFGDWSLHCVAGASDASPAHACEIAQLVTAQIGEEMVTPLELAVAASSADGSGESWRLVAVTPPEVLLSADFGLSVDDGAPTLHRYHSCDARSCMAVIDAQDALIDRMKRGVSGAAYFRLLDGQTIKVAFSLDGFTRAFDALSAHEPRGRQQATAQDVDN